MDHLFIRMHTFSISQAAIISLGLIGAGTNNARIAGMLRNLSSYYYKDASLLFCVWVQFDRLNHDAIFTHPNAVIFLIESKICVANCAGAHCSRSCPSGQRVVNTFSISF